MSDREGHSGGTGGPDEDLSLPKATVAKMISELLPSDITCAKETRDLIIECCVGEHTQSFTSSRRNASVDFF
ncbi:hypothetical protein SERLADRAFT_382078 [Serpula lacrymans var. lacrymans S7.9]|uniref:Transcription factor CBF/NF-Y/archaeal histone domain-containing protein n=1 Tax=Serpula lacrymans var. lacrymans (strain S7.9) TaxID=578457 RepID=F8NMH8_SERL9|nr:uncharacterized protein SERLADRAFT_382078 [Serpula lacrymans var. lacrymans S7.9]EGO27375.1 hypothetical protein SERLADRAFT_382078 [Serpula lacrymans var. lacrymans S7.9]